jgi:dienelactone hydrolase
VTRAREYAPGKSLDVNRPTVGRADGGAPVVLAWHGNGPDERDALAPLAAALADRGLLVLVPDWQSDDFAVGARQLLASVDFVREEAGPLGGDPDRVVLAGWSLGANAAVWVGLHPGALGGWEPAAVVGLGGSYFGSPFGDDVFADVDPDDGPRRAVLVHGTRDTLVPPGRSAEAADRLARSGWTVRLRQVDTDHAGVIGTVYDRTRGRCVPSDDPSRTAALVEVADVVARLALGP